MITRIELTNFMSHERTVIEPAAGLTVLVGPNNCGKSALVAALQILCHNDSSTYVMRHGAKECCVRVETDDGHQVEWRRKNSPSYEIDGQKFDRLGIGGLPELLHKALRLPLVEGVGDDGFGVHFGAQKSPIFLLNNPPAAAARFFASSSDASRLVAMQKKHKDKLAERQREKARVEAESKRLTVELEALQPAAELDRRLKAVEQEHAGLLRRSIELEQAEQAAAALEMQHKAASHCQSLVNSLTPLAPPPELAPIAPLANLIDAIERAIAARELAVARAKGLASLAAPPLLADTASLESLADQLVALHNTVEQAIAQRHHLATLPEPPRLADPAPLSSLVGQLDAASNQVERWQAADRCSAAVTSPPLPAEMASLADCTTQLAAAAAQFAAYIKEQQKITEELNVAAAALREAAEGESCPTCGAPLDADRLLTAASSGLGGHVHA